MKWSDFEHYLKAEHLAGRRVTVTIARVLLEETHGASGKAETKPVMYFQGAKKGLILSPTNQRTLKTLFGDDVQACIGKPIVLEAITMRVAGRDTQPIRINALGSASPPTQEPDDEETEGDA